jgi:hypothetical protein
MSDEHTTQEGAIDIEFARAEFDRFKESMRLKLDSDWIDKNERRDIDEDVAYLVSLIQERRVTVSDSGKISFQPWDSDKWLHFSKPNGQNLAVIDRMKEHQKIAQQHALIGSLTRTPSKMIAQMDQDDIDVCATICGLFFVR